MYIHYIVLYPYSIDIHTFHVLFISIYRDL